MGARLAGKIPQGLRIKPHCDCSRGRKRAARYAIGPALLAKGTQPRERGWVGYDRGGDDTA